MTDTPTTDEVKDHATDYNGLGMDTDAFDRWLAEHDRQTAELAWYEGMEAGQKAIVTRAFTPNNPYEKDINK